MKTRKSIRFSVTDGDGKRSSTWKCFVAKSPKNDVYLTCREIGSALKSSLHESGNWHYAYIKNYFEENFTEEERNNKDRFIEKWSRPPEIAPGVTLALRIVIPWGSVNIPIDIRDMKNIFWASKPPEGHAIEFDLIFTKNGTNVSDWPGKKDINTQLVGSFMLSNGDIAWIVFREIIMPKIPPQSVNLKFFRGIDGEMLKSKNLHMQALTVEGDGSRILFDFAVQYDKNIGT